MDPKKAFKKSWGNKYPNLPFIHTWLQEEDRPGEIAQVDSHHGRVCGEGRGQEGDSPDRCQQYGGEIPVRHNRAVAARSMGK